MHDADGKRPFVEPTITPEASLTDVTLLSGGIGRHKGGPSHDSNPHGGGQHGGEHHGSGGHGH